MQITEKAWLEYITKMSQISQKAADLMQSWVQKNGLENDKALFGLRLCTVTTLWTGYRCIIVSDV